MSATPNARVGFVGLGKMGWPMATNLANAGFKLAVHDSAEGRAASFTEAQEAVAPPDLPSLAQLSDIVVLMLPTGAIVHDVVLGTTEAPGLVNGLASGSVIVDMSSSEPVGTRELAALLPARGVHLVDAPVSGGVKRAESGTLAIMAGGDARMVERVRPVFDVLGSTVFHTGDSGSGHAMKALNNYVSAAGLCAAAEALTIGQRFGLEPHVIADVLNASTGRNNATENKLHQFIISGTFDSGFALRLMAKDQAIAHGVAMATGTVAPLLHHMNDMWRAAAETLEDEADHTEIALWVELMAGKPNDTN